MPANTNNEKNNYYSTINGDSNLNTNLNNSVIVASDNKHTPNVAGSIGPVKRDGNQHQRKSIQAMVN